MSYVESLHHLNSFFLLLHEMCVQCKPWRYQNQSCGSFDRGRCGCLKKKFTEEKMSSGSGCGQFYSWLTDIPAHIWSVLVPMNPVFSQKGPEVFCSLFYPKYITRAGFVTNALFRSKDLTFLWPKEWMDLCRPRMVSWDCMARSKEWAQLNIYFMVQSIIFNPVWLQDVSFCCNLQLPPASKGVANQLDLYFMTFLTCNLSTLPESRLGVP